MNYTRFISFTVLAAILSSCEFNEDFCIRNGELVAWCDFSGIRETPPVPEERHIIAFPSGMDIPSGEQMTFTRIPCAKAFHKVNTNSYFIPGIMK